MLSNSIKKIGKFFLVLFLILTGIWFYRQNEERKRLRKEQEEKLAIEKEKERKRLCDFFKSKISHIYQANSKFIKYLDFKTGYFTNYQLTSWRGGYKNLFFEISDKPFKSIQLTDDEVNSISDFIDYYKNSEAIRKNFNEQFIEEELKAYKSFFDNIEGRKLDKQQRTAVVTDDDNNIVIAGAGSGKTTTIVGKVNYIIDRYNIDPKEILLISFTNKSASTLADRIDIEEVVAKTFHKFGKDIIVEAEAKQPSIFDEAQFSPLLTKYFTELIKNQAYLNKVTDYFTEYLKPPKTQFEFDNKGDYIQYLKDKNFRTYKQVEVQGRGGITFNMEVVKSIEECKIANFLLFNGINYNYEFPYEHDTATEKYRQYKPDFTIIQDDIKVYIEHFGISRSGNVPSWFSSDGIRSASEKYRDDMNWKRETHNKFDTLLIETYSYEMSEGILFENLIEHLTEAGLTLRPKSPEEIWKIITNVAKDEVKTFITLFGTFINLMKSNNYTINDVVIKNNQGESDFFKSRNSLFIEIIKPIFERYEKHLKERNEIDFSDMINKASKHIENGKHKRKISYVLIDEFQDISIGRYQLVKAIKINNPSCKLFCVGDDWQSIYRFSGSDIALFKEFEKYFGFTVKSKIETTYRFQNPLINLSSNFILKNPNQAKKELRGTSSSKNTTFKIQYSITENQDDTDALKSIIRDLVTTVEDIDKKEIMILGRYGFDIKRIKNETGLFNIDEENGLISFSHITEDDEHMRINLQFLTVHKAKGLEADIVIILNCNSGKYGFPSEMSDDEVLNLLLSEADQFENGEERRLFYVAMSRAKERVYFVADSSFKSKFIAELEVVSGQSPNKKCPICKTADIVLRKTGTTRNGNEYKFYGCTNYLYGCDYTNTEYVNNYDYYN
jgi:DNA helicase-4